METEVTYTIVGAFVIFLTTMLVFFIIWLSSGFAFTRYNTYEVNLEESVSGLNVGSVVEFNGVVVGSIKNIGLNIQNTHLVNVLIDVRYDIPVTRSTVATLSTRGITGGVFLTLQDKGLDHRPLTVLPGHLYPIIPTIPSIFVRLDAVLTNIDSSFKQISISMKSLFNKENLNHIKRTLANLTIATQKLTPFLNSGSVFLKSGSSTFKNIQIETIPHANQLITNMSNVVNNLSKVTKEIKNNPSILVRGKAPAKPGPGE